MSNHSFSPEIAKLVSVQAAVIYQNLTFWVEKNAANNKNFHEGRFWTYNSITAFAKLFSYLTPKQIRTCLEKLVEAELVVKGNFGEDVRDRTNWYSVNPEPGSDSNPPFAQTGKRSALKGKLSAPEGKSYKNIYKPNIKPSSTTCVEADINEVFEKIWKHYPDDKKRNKPNCEAIFDEFVSLGVPADVFLKATQDYGSITKPYTRSNVKFSDNWFKYTNWLELAEQRNSNDQATQDALERSLKLCKMWIETQNTFCKHITKKQISALIASGEVSIEMIQSVGLTP